MEMTTFMNILEILISCRHRKYDKLFFYNSMEFVLSLIDRKNKAQNLQRKLIINTIQAVQSCNILKEHL